MTENPTERGSCKFTVEEVDGMSGFSMEIVTATNRMILRDIFPNLSRARVIHLGIDDRQIVYHS
jgi:hypothetical protein